MRYIERSVLSRTATVWCEANSVSTVKVVQAINACLGQAEFVEASHKTRVGAVKNTRDTERKAGKASFSQGESGKWELPKSIVTEFAEWDDAMSKLEDKFGASVLARMPAMFERWLGKFATAPAEAPAA